MDTCHDQHVYPDARRPLECTGSVRGMTKIELLALLLALSLAILLALVAGILAKASGKSVAAAALVGGGVLMTAMAVYFAAVAAYR